MAVRQDVRQRLGAPATPERGASIGERGAYFEVWAPYADRVWVEVFDGTHVLQVPLSTVADGVFGGLANGVRAGADYRYRLASHGRTLYRPDPVSRCQPYGVHGSSRIVDPSAFVWNDQAWRGAALGEQVLYEAHVGTFTQAGTFDALVERLGAMRYLGVTTLALMPVAEFPGDRNWGYDGVCLYAPESTYGVPDALRRLIDAAHRRGLAVVLDVVYTHLGPEGNYLGDFGPYFTDRHRTPWGAALNFDGPESDEVRRFVVDNARHWIAEYHLDGLRLDAAQWMVDTSPRHVVEEIATACHEVGAARGRRVLVLASSEENDPRLVRPRRLGGFGLDGVWSDDFHHAVHAALTGESRARYIDFRGVRPIAKSLRDRFVYDGAHSAFRHRRLGAPAGDVPADRFIVFVQNHEQVGNRPQGERLAALVPPDRLRLAAALLLLSPYVPLLFMGEEYGETSPFLYFVSHDDAAVAEAVRENRRRELLAWPEDMPDPQAAATFARAKLVRERARRPDRRALQGLYRRLLRLRREEPALLPGAGTYEVHGGSDATWVALALHAPRGADLLAIFNLGDRQDVVVPAGPGPWEARLSTDARRWGGEGAEPEAVVTSDGVRVTMPAWSAVLYRAPAAAPADRSPGAPS